MFTVFDVHNDIHLRQTAGTPALHRRVPHSHPGVKPIAMHPQLSPIAVTRSIVQDAAWPSSNSPAQLAEHSATSSTAQSEAHSTLQSGPQSKVQSWYDLPEHQRQAASFEQPSKAPQDSGDSDPPLPIRRAPRASRHPPTAPLRQPSASQSPASQAAAAGQLVIMGQSRRHESPSKSVCSRYPPGSANPSSDGRTVVVSGFRKGSAGPQAKQQTLDMCAQFGDVSCCWLRKGRSSCWFSIVQFAEVSTPQGLSGRQSHALLRCASGHMSVPMEFSHVSGKGFAYLPLVQARGRWQHLHFDISIATFTLCEGWEHTMLHKSLCRCCPVCSFVFGRVWFLCYMCVILLVRLQHSPHQPPVFPRPSSSTLPSVNNQQQQQVYLCMVQVSSAQAAVQQCCGRSTSSSCLGMRWYLTEAPSAHPSQTLQSQHLKPKCQDSSGASEALLGRSGSKEGHVPQQDAAVLDVSRPHITGRWMPWSTGTLLRVLFGCCLLCVYFVLLGYGF